MLYGRSRAVSDCQQPRRISESILIKEMTNRMIGDRHATICTHDQFDNIRVAPEPASTGLQVGRVDESWKGSCCESSL
jgi:hypothetical protein